MDNQWVNNLTRITMQAMEEKGLSDICYGTVVSANPLQVQIDQKTILRPTQLILSKCLSDRSETMTIPGVGKVAVTVHGGLKDGEKVLLVRAAGGQRFAVIDRY